MIVVSREEFKLLIVESDAYKREDLVADDGPLWIPEREILIGPPAQWFAQINTRKRLYRSNDTYSKNQFWSWIGENCNGLVRCYTSGQDHDWWGFVEEKDAFWFSLRWS